MGRRHCNLVYKSWRVWPKIAEDGNSLQHKQLMDTNGRWSHGSWKRRPFLRALHSDFFNSLGMPIPNWLSIVLCFSFFFVFSGSTSRKIISESTGPIFTKFSDLVDVWGASLIIHSFCNGSRDVAMAINFVDKFAKLIYATFIRRTVVPKRIGGLRFQFHNIKWQWFLDIVYKFGAIQSSKPGVYGVRICTAGV